MSRHVVPDDCDVLLRFSVTGAGSAGHDDGLPRGDQRPVSTAGGVLVGTRATSRKERLWRIR
jgi:hypothetical protein